MNKKLLLFCSGVMLSTSLWAQTKTISGKVTNASDGTSLSNVTVSIKGKAVSTQTNPDGSFTIKAEPGDVLIFSAIGSKSTQQTIGSSSTINMAQSLFGRCGPSRHRHLGSLARVRSYDFSPCTCNVGRRHCVRRD